MDPLAELIGESPEMIAIRETIGRLLQRQSDARRLPPILIQGETGTGKGLVARALHQAGPRASAPFVDVNCAAIPETLLESEMFGFERGAFTDARQAKRGLFQAAHRGTLFLDEVGLLPEGLQAKLLKVIEERAVRRLGSTRSEPVDVWVLTATSENLLTATRERRFREDLYHRLAVLTLWLPPLRDRGGDVGVLAEHFLARACADYGLPVKRLTGAARGALAAYRWPGNVRELINAMERVALLSEGEEVTPEGLGLPVGAPAAPDMAAPPAERTASLDDTVGEVERAHLLKALEATHWNISRAAARLGLPRNTLRYRIEKYGLGRGTAAPHRRERAEPAAAPATPPRATVPMEPPAPTVVRWERRRLALLRVSVVMPGPADPATDLSRVPALLVEKVQSFGGRIQELSPAGIVAAFGLEPVEDAPARAALAAIAIQKAAERVAGGGGGLGVKMAIHVGQFMLGRLGDATMIDHDAKREAWAILEELVRDTELDTTLVSRTAAAFLDRRFELARAGPVAPTREASRLVGLERTGLRPGGQMARFVGRQHDLELLKNRLESAMRGQGQVVGIVGEPGIGKSRLLFESRQALAGHEVTYLEGRCVAYGSTIPYLPVLDILRASCGLAETDPPEVMSARIHGSLDALGIDPAEAAPYLLDLLGLKRETHRLATLSPEAVKARTFDILRQVSLRRSRNAPLIIVMEDLHWVDQTSEELLASLVEMVPGSRILLVTTYRPGYRPPWIEKSYATQMALQPLAAEESLSVVRSVLGVDEVPDSVGRLILAKAEGNPFFLEELARAVREQGGFAVDSSVPDTIEEVILARIDRLSLEDKGLLQEASVIGKDVPVSLVEAIATLPADALGQGLRRLRAAEFLVETSPGPEVEYTFKHALTHEVAYGSLLPGPRRDLHGRIVETIERLHAGRLSEHIERLAHHALRAEAWDKAVVYLRQAGAKAVARSAHREAAVYFEQALESLKRLPAGQPATEQAIDLRLDLRTALLPLGEFGRIYDALREAEGLATTLGDRPRLGRIEAYLSDCFRLMGDQSRAIEAGQRALTLARELEDFPLQVVTHTYLGLIYHGRGDYRRAIDFLRWNVEALAGDLSRVSFDMAQLPSVHSRTWLVWCLAELGEFEEGRVRGEEGAHIAESVDHPMSLTVAYTGIGRLYLHQGDLARATPVLERALELSHRWGITVWRPNIVSALGHAYALQGRLVEALPLLEQGVEAAATGQFMVGQSLRVGWLSEGYRATGREAEALGLARTALELARGHQERGHEAWALRLIADLTSTGEPLDAGQAEAGYRQALGLAEELGMRPLQAHCHLGLSRLYRRTADPPRSATHRASATALFHQMDMRWWLERAAGEPND
ncbi:MAG TPA: sigma 54-interacting transcriptional regulator [Methylomirabilota bacterium]|nr:sigma 54-interacting transcriptional regulator [Methylomirabilota bacterium]